MIIENQLRQLVSLMSDRGLSSLVLADPLNLAWLLGCRTHVSLVGSPCLLALVTADHGSPRLQIITTNNEVHRLAEVELNDFARAGSLEFVTAPWTAGLWTLAPAGGDIGSDVPAENRQSIATEMARLRLTLTPTQAGWLGELTAIVAAAVERIAVSVQPGQLESDIAARTAAELVSQGIDPIVLLVGSGEALFTHRHPLPRPVPVEQRCMISVGARGRGQFTSVTRYVHFGRLSTFLADAFSRLLAVEAAFLDASQPGRPLSSVLAAGRTAYAANGFGEDAWADHHQGGLGGFAARELIAGRDADVILTPGMVAAWNPTAAGWKAEDVTLITEQGNVPQTPTSSQWPMLDVNGRRRAGYLTA